MEQLVADGMLLTMARELVAVQLQRESSPFTAGACPTFDGVWVNIGAPNPPVGEYNKEVGLKGLKVLDRRLGESEWLAGERLTIADIIAFIGIDFTRMIKLPIPEELADLHRWANAMRSRPAAKAAM